MTYTQPYILVVSSGRSGSNRILELLHHHTGTVTRSENFLSQMDPAVDMPLSQSLGDYDEHFPETFKRHIEEARYRSDQRDHEPAPRKQHYRFGPGSFLVERLLWKRSVRRQIKWVFRSLDKKGWSKPTWHLNREAFAQSLLVIKGAMPPWIELTHTNDQNQKFIHGLREPIGYLNSWYNRFIQAKGHDLSDVLKQTLSVLPKDHPAHERLAPRADDPTLEDVCLAELWWWRSRNERFYGFNGSSRYYLSRFDKFKSEPHAEISRILAFCGLPEEDQVIELATSGTNKIFKSRQQDQLDPSMVDRVIAEAVSGTPLLEALE